MATIDLELPESVKRALTPPQCLDLRLPKPGKRELKLPTGGTIKPLPDITKGIPTDCSMDLNLALQIAPIMASMECLLKILAFLGVVVNLVKKIADPSVLPPQKLSALVSALPDLAEKGDALLPCINMVVLPPLNIIPFIKSLLLMLARMLRCAADALRSAIAVLDGIELDLASAKTNGNDELAAQLQCAQENAQLAMDGTMVSLEPVMVLLAVASPFLEIAGQPVAIGPFVSDGTLDGMKSMLEVIDSAATMLQSVAEPLPG